MSARVAQIWRHPIKGIGREALNAVALTMGKCLPYDRYWALAHEAADLGTGQEWVRCGNFLRGAKAPELMAIDASFDEASGTVTLTHPRQPDLTINPEEKADVARLIAWLAPLYPSNRAAPTQMVSVGRGMTDSRAPTVSLMNLASHRAVEEAAGQDLSILRWRGNIFFENSTAWAERDWIGKRVRIGDAELDIVDHIERCMATHANPETGMRDVEMLTLLEENWGHRDFGVFGIVTKSGEIRPNDSVEVIT